MAVNFISLIIKRMKMGPIGWIAFILVVVGGLNWGLVGAFKFDLVAAIFGDMSVVSRVVYILVGLSALYMIVKPFLKGKAAAAVATEAPAQA